MLQKQTLPINFSQGLDLKTDPFQVKPGNFLSLENSVFTKGGLLQKRNGYQQLSLLPDTSSTYLSTFNGNLTAIGTSLSAYSQSNETWVNKGSIQPLKLSTLPLIRSNTNQSQMDSAISSNGLICTVFTDNVPSGGSTVPVYKYVIAESDTGQNIVSPTPIPVTSGTVTGSPRVFVMGRFFVIVFTNVITAVNHLQYIAINISVPTMVTANTDISNQYVPATTLSFDGIVANDILYLAWAGSGNTVKMRFLTSTLILSNTLTVAGQNATIMSVCADNSGIGDVIYASYYNLGTTTGKTLVVDSLLNVITAPVTTITGITVDNLTSTADNQLCTILYEVANNYGYDSAIPTHFIRRNTITQAGVVGTSNVAVRSIGLASKSIILNDSIYFLGVYSSPFQPSYFLMNSLGQVISKLAYSNGSGYYTTGLPSITEIGNVLDVPYLVKDLIASVNKTQGDPSPAGVYSQTGINLASFTVGTSNIITSEIGSNLNITGGFMWAYDGYSIVENNFFVWPDSVEVTTSGSGGSITAQQYYYVATYEWSDNQGNVFRSAPSIPVVVTTTGSTSSNTINVPTLRLTYKINNPVKIVIYRWSVVQEIYYQVTSQQVPLFNDVTVDYVTFVDTLADSAIIGNTILYTTGGVLENISPPALDAITLYQSRLFLVDSEDKNLLWYSKQVIENTPVEMSDLLTIYVAPTTAAQGSTGPITALSVLDDKLIIFKKDAIYYINGTGPDNTGANSQFSEPIFISSTIGCANELSIVFTPMGLMFQSDKGIWLLSRDLSTQYIGAPVEKFNSSVVESALSIPATNQVRFTLNTGETLMYDYYYGQWGTFVGIPAISSTLYQGLHTFLDKYGRIFQENLGVYLDGSNPVLLSFTTSWFNLIGLQGYQSVYEFFLLGVYYSPHKLNLQIAYDYNPSPSQSTLITPDNFSPNYGISSPYGEGTYGGPGNLEEWRVFLKKHRCKSFQITLSEAYDSTFGQSAGQGLTLSGINLVYARRSGFTTISSAKSVGR